MIHASNHEKYTPWFAEAGAACRIVPLSRFVGPNAFALKGGGYGCLFSLIGIDEEGRTDEELEAAVRSIEGALHGLPEGSCLYQYTRVASGFELPRQQTYANPVTQTFVNDRLSFLQHNAGFRRIHLHWCLTFEPPTAGPLQRPPQNANDNARLLAELEKTTTLKAIQPTLEQHGYEVIGLAATSGAVKAMQAAGLEARTIQLHLVQDQPSAQPRYYVVDEASLASTRMVHELMQKLKSEDRVLFVGDIRQHQSVEAGRIYAQMREAGMAGTTLRQIVRQKDPELKRAVENLSAGNIDSAVELLQQQGRVHEFSNKNERYQALAREYASSAGRTLIVSPDNESRQAINKVVREHLQLSGPEYRQQILIARQDLAQEDRKIAAGYRVDDVIKFHKSNKTLGVDKGDYLSVIAVDRINNLITVKAGTQIKTYNPERAYGVQVYERGERIFTERERVQLTAPWKSKALANRQMGTLERVDKKGNVTMKLDADQDERRVRFNLNEMKHLDYGYAVTSFSSQGSTVEKVLVNVNTQDSRVQKLIGQRFAYVASRAESDAQICTDNAERLAQALGQKQDKTQALHPEEVQTYREQAIQIRNNQRAYGMAV